MANKPTQAQVDAQIVRLREIKPKVRRYTMFNDDNWDALEAQIRVLQQKLDEDDVYDEWILNDFIIDRARSAAKWLAGEDDEKYPFEDEWNNLVEPQ